MMLQLLVSLLPILLFCLALMFLDSYKLIRPRSVLLAIGAGMLIAGVVLEINMRLIGFIGPHIAWFSRYFAPVIEEIFKASVIIVLVLKRKVGFMVDAAVFGVAVGAGFSMVENLYYLSVLNERNLLLWLVRGFGTAMMHGGSTAIVGIVARNLYERVSRGRIRIFIPGLLIAIVFHSLFNHFILSPVISTILIVIVLPLLMITVFRQSEESTRKWLGAGLDADLEVLNLVTIDNLADSKLGRYLQTLRSRFPPLVVGDMLCYIRMYTELSMRAKGLQIMREAGISPPGDPELAEKFSELKYLQKSIGRTGLMAIAPILHTSSRSLWQISLLDQ
jgi:protease PrsW